MYTTFVDKRYSNYDIPNKSSNYSKNSEVCFALTQTYLKPRKGLQRNG